MKKKWFLPLLCTLPVAGILLWFLAGQNLNNFALFTLFLACPLSHLLLHHEGHHGKSHSPQNTDSGNNNPVSQKK